MTILLVRHARAGRRERWKGDDRLRPVSKKGRLQAAALPDLLHPWTSARRTRPSIVSSPWTRCVETLDPLALALDVQVVQDDALGEGMGAKAVDLVPLWLRRSLVIACTHGDVISDILASLGASGVPLGKHPAAVKGSVWVLEGTRAGVRTAQYLPPPS